VALSFFALLILGGSLGYHLIEGWPLADSFYMTVITLSTVGYGEVHDLSAAGKLFTTLIIFVGVGTLAYTAGRFTETVLERGLLRGRRKRMELKRLRDHVLICGFGRMGAVVCHELQTRGIPFVVVEKDPAVLEQLEALEYRLVAGDATDDDALVRGGVHRARAVAAALPHDADNLFVTLTARSLNPDITVIARSSHPKNDTKMIAAGAARVLNPFLSGGRLMARQLVHPSVTEFIEGITGPGSQLGLEELQIPEGSPLDGVPLRNTPIRKEADVIVVGVRGQDGLVRFNPSPDLVLRAGEVLIVLGTRENLRALERLAEPRAT
jgi:voltage-gated potassium channel